MGRFWVILPLLYGAVFGGTLDVPESTLQCGFPDVFGAEFRCSAEFNMTCRAARAINQNVVAPICFPVEEIEAIYAAGGNDSVCGPELAVVCADLSENLLPQFLSCNSTAEKDECPPKSHCVATDTAGAGLCCSDSTALVAESVVQKSEFDNILGPAAPAPDRKKRDADNGKKKRSGQKKRQRKRKEEEEEEPPALVTSPPDNGDDDDDIEKKCRKVTETTEFDGKIVSVKLWENLGYHKCDDNDFEIKKRKTLFKVKDCKAIWKVCYKEEKETTIPPLKTTAEPKEKCIELDNEHGLVKHCPGRITKVVYRPGSKNNGKGKGKGKDKKKFKKEDCVEDVDYFLKDKNTFVANSRCPGTFKICHVKKEDVVTVPPVTTEGPETKCRKVYVLKKKLERKFKGDIISFQILKEFFHGHKKKSLCEKGKTFKVVDGNVFVVKGHCKGVFEVCFEHKPKQTTIPPITTTIVDEECEKIINVHGLKKVFDGEVRSAKFIEVKHNRHKAHGYGCHEHLDFAYFENFFFANARCIGFFSVCYKKPSPSTPMATTAGHPEPECTKVAIHKDGKTEFDGRIQSAQVVKQIPLFGYGYGFKVCEEGENYSIKGNVLIVKKCPGLFKVCYFPGEV